MEKPQLPWPVSCSSSSHQPSTAQKTNFGPPGPPGPVMALPLCAGQDGAHCQQDTNLTASLLFQYRTVLVPVVKSPGFPKIPGKSLSFIYFAPDADNPGIHRPVFLELTPSPEMTYRTLPGTSNEMNVLGIVIFSATIGTCSAESWARRCPDPARTAAPRGGNGCGRCAAN